MQASMNAIFRAAAMVAMLALFSFCAAASAAEPPFRGDAAKARQVWVAFERWLAAYGKGDLNAVMAIFDTEVVFAYQGTKDQKYADLKAAYAADFKSRASGSEWVPVIDEIYADGKLAFVRATWELRVKSAAGKIEVKERNRGLDVLRQSGNTWRIFRSVNYAEPK
jgi:ketosteroid isomerase-like protein